jgi:hypothetical protein
MKKTYFVIAILISALRLPAQTNAPVRLAIVSESTEAFAAADVLTAELSSHKNLQLLERNEIEKVYREQGLTAGNKDYLKLGQILGADGLLALQPVTEGANHYLSAQLVAVRPGVILEDRRIEWQATVAAGWAENFQHHLDPLLPKLLVLPQDAIPISVVNFHAGVRTLAAVELEQQIFFLTVERLVREKRLFVLERKRMQSLSEEKELANQETVPFWNGKYLLDGAIDRDGFDPNIVTINARLIPPGGSPIFIEAKGSRTNCTEVVNQFVEKVLAAFKIDARPAAWNTADEAEKFFKEAQWNLAWKIFPQARQSAAAAWALGKHDNDAKILRVRTFMPPPDSGIIYFPPREKPALEKIEAALHALSLYQMFSQDLPSDEPKPDSAWYKLGLDNLTIATRVLQQFNWSPEFYEPVADKLAELRAEARSTAALLSRSPAVQDSYFVGNRPVKYGELYHFMEKESIYGLKLDGGCLWQETPEDTVANYRELMGSPVFCYLHRRFWFRDDFIQSGLPQLPPRLVAWDEADQKRIPKVWGAFTNELLNSTNVFWQMEARAVRLADIKFPDMNRDFDTRAASEAAYRTANQTYDKELSSAFTDFFDAFITNRIYFKTNNVDVLYLNWGVGDLVERMGGNIVTPAKESLRERFKTEYAAKLSARDSELNKLTANAGNQAAFEKQKMFLQSNQPFDPDSFVQMFIFGFKDYSKAQAGEIKPLLAEYKKHLSGKWARIGEMQVGQVEANIERVLNPTVVAATPPPNRTTGTNVGAPRSPAGNFQPGLMPLQQSPGAGPNFAQPSFPPTYQAAPAKVPDTLAPESIGSSNIITVRDFYPLPLDGMPGDKPHSFQFIDHQWMEGKLLFDFRYNAWVYSFDKNGNWQSSADKVFVGMAVFDPNIRNWVVAVLPDSFKEPVNFTSQQGILWRGNLYSSHVGKIQKYDSLKQAWQPAGFAVEGGQYHNLNGRLYRTDYNSIQEITENGRATKVLASIQRQPPVSSLDSLGALMNLALFTDTQKNLCAAVHNKIFRWDGTDWHEIGAASTSYMPAVFDEGVIFSTDGFNLKPARISRFGMQSNLVEICLSQIAKEPSRREYEPRRAGTNTAQNPLWKLPAELSLPNLSASLRQSDLYLMADHSEKKDGYNASLFCFSRDLSAALKVRLNFEASDAFPAGIGFAPGIAMPGTVGNRGWMQFTTNLMLCGRYSVPEDFKPGLWVMPVSQLEPAIAAQKQMQLEREAQAVGAAAQTKKDLLTKYDLNHNGIIDPDEKEAALDEPAFIESELDIIDANHNGLLDAKELAYFDVNQNKLLELKEQTGIEIAQHLLAESFLKRFDVNGDGLLDEREISDLVQVNTQTTSDDFFYSQDRNHDRHIDLGELEIFLQNQTFSHLRPNEIISWARFKSAQRINRPVVDPRQIFQEDVEYYWQNSVDAAVSVQWKPTQQQEAESKQTDEERHRNLLLLMQKKNSTNSP